MNSLRRFLIIFLFTLTLVVFSGVAFLYVREGMIKRGGSTNHSDEFSTSELKITKNKSPEAATSSGAAMTLAEGSEDTDTFDTKKDETNDDVQGATESETVAEEHITDKNALTKQEDPYADVPEDNFTRKVDAASTGVVSLAFAGDILFDRNYAIQAQMEQRGSGIEGAIGASLLEKMRGADIFVVNNEFPYTDRGTPKEGKTFTFHAAVNTVRQLKEMGTDLAGLANNHTFDYGETGFLDTLDTLDRAGMMRMGAGRDITEASHPVYFIAGGMKIAFVAATQIERLDNPDTRGATETLPGVFRCLDDTLLLQKVREAKAESDFVVVFIHWGTENETQPDWLQKKQAPELAGAGADLIIGAHSHCLQPIGFEGKTPVIYSMGNFLFNSKTLDTCLIECNLSRTDSVVKLISLKFVPCIQSGCRVYESDGDDSARILQFMRDISPGVNIGEDGFIDIS